MIIPADELQKRGYVVDYAHLDSVKKSALADAKAGRVGVGAYNIYVVPRTAYAGERALELLKAAGKKLVFEVDDDFTNRHRQVLNDPMLFDAIWRFVRQYCDAILCSTEPLAAVMRQETDKPVFIAHNAVNWKQWRVPKQKRITIGLTGSITHYNDWSVLVDVLPGVLERHADVQLMLAGYTPEYFADLQTRFPEQVVIYEPRPYLHYPAVAGSAHIVLCPVDPDDGFNMSKSGIKALEGMASGAAVIATNFEIYSTVVPKSIGYLVPQTPEAWREAIEDALMTRAWETRGEMGRSLVRRQHSIDQTWHEWWRAFKAIAAM